MCELLAYERALLKFEAAMVRSNRGVKDEAVPLWPLSPPTRPKDRRSAEIRRLGELQGYHRKLEAYLRDTERGKPGVWPIFPGDQPEVATKSGEIVEGTRGLQGTMEVLFGGK
ncbi:MAG: hypothetical protein HYY16_08575 [Planctomycetes bacterium]|nr:hypothetical protein [Planctomycetota bacterium]